MNIPFRDILQRLGIGGGTSKSVLGIDIGSSSIKIVQLKRERGTAVLETYGELALGPYADQGIGQAVRPSYEKLLEALTDVLTESNTTTREGGVSIPFSSSLITVAKIPAVEESQLEKMVPIEARKYIPVPMSEVTLDWFVIPKRPEDADGKTKTDGETNDVLLVAIHNDVLSTYQQLVTDAELSAHFFEIEIFSTIRSVLDRSGAPVMVMDFGAASTKIYIVERGIIRFSHSVRKGGQDITQALSQSLGVTLAKAEALKREQGLQTDDSATEEGMLLTVAYIFSEANRVLLNYQKKYNVNVGSVVLTGGGALLTGMQAYAQEQLSAEVTLAHPFAKTDTPAFLEDTLTEAGPAFAVAVGLALRRLEELG